MAARSDHQRGDSSDDPFVLLGVDRRATVHELRAARRRLALEAHPDRHGGDQQRMQRVNAAFEAAVVIVGAAGAEDPPMAANQPPDDEPSDQADVARMPGRVASDVASFTIDVLPAEAFEVLLVAATRLGEVLGDDPPYELDVMLGPPFDCWCRFGLLPDAGSSTVGITLATFEGSATWEPRRRGLPDLDAVRDAVVAELNTVGRAGGPPP